jgi:hypothetical protein
MNLVRISLFSLGLSLVWAGCGEDEDAGGGNDTADSGSKNDAGHDASQTTDASDDGNASDAQQSTTGPIVAPKLAWTEVSFPNTQCRDGSPAGIRVNLNPDSNKLMIYFQGGGACHSPWSCSFGNPANIPGARTLDGPMKGIFERRADNPVGDWNWVYIPYCTGDVHGGNNDNGTYTDGGAVQHYVGYKNVEKFLERIVPTFPNVTHVLQTGSSAGGFGAGLNAALVATKFPSNVKATLIDDSGPPFSKAYLSSCLQKQWRTTWGFDETFLGTCGADCPDHDDFALAWAQHLLKIFPNSYGGLVSSAHDGIISLYFGLGRNSCKIDPTVQPPPVPPTEFGAGLMDLRAKMKAVSNKFGTYYIPGSNLHVWLVDDKFYNTEVDGVKLVDWARDLLNDKAAHVGNAMLSSDAGTDGG